MKASPLLRATNRGFVLALLCGACIGKLELDDRVIAAEKSLSTQTEPYHYQGVPTSSSSDSTGAALERGSERKRAGVHRDECRADGRTSMLGLPINVEARQRFPMSCVPASAARAGSLASGKKITERQMREAIDPAHNWSLKGTSVTKAAPALNSAGVSASVIDYHQIHKSLTRGPVIVVVPSRTGGTHAVVCMGRNPKGSFIIWDPDPPRGYDCSMTMTASSILPNYPAVSVPMLRSGAP